jgi:hypothetical protein
MGMYEYEQRTRPSHNEIPVRGKENGEKRGAFLTGIQIVICIIFLLAAFGIKQFGGGFYKTAKLYVTEALSDSITNEQVSQVFDSIREKLPSASEIFSSGATASSDSSDTSKSSSKPVKQTTSATTAATTTAVAKPTTSSPNVSLSSYSSAESLKYSYRNSVSS